MPFEEHPFMSAQNLMDDGAGWAGELMLPEGHPDRCGDDPASCLEQVLVHLDSAACMLIEGGSESKEVGTEEFEGYTVPILRREVHDPVMVEAGEAIHELARPFRAWHLGGEPIELTEAVIKSMRDLLPVRFKERFDADVEAYDRAADNAPF